MARMTNATALRGVQQERTYSPTLFPSRIFSRKNEGCAVTATAPCPLAMVVLLLLDLVAPLREHVEPHEQRGPQRHDEGRSAEGALDVVGDGLLGEVRLERELLRLDVGQVQPARPAHLVLAVDVVHVAARVGVDAGLRDVEQLVALAEGERAGGADLRARGLEPLRLAIRTERALADARRDRVVLVLRDLERAGDHAVPAAEAVLRVVDDRAARQLVHGANRAGRRAAGRQ